MNCRQTKAKTPTPKTHTDKKSNRKI